MEQSWNGEDLEINNQEIDAAYLSGPEDDTLFETNITDDTPEQTNIEKKDSVEPVEPVEEVNNSNNNINTFIQKYKYIILLVIIIIFSNSYVKDILPGNLTFIKDLLPVILSAVFIIYTENLKRN